MASIDVADKITLDNINNIVGRGIVKSVQSGNYVFDANSVNSVEITINPVNPAKTIVIAQPEEIYACHYEEFGEKVYKTRVAFLTSGGSKLALYATYNIPVSTMTCWQVIEFY